MLPNVGQGGTSGQHQKEKSIAARRRLRKMPPDVGVECLRRERRPGISGCRHGNLLALSTLTAIFMFNSAIRVRTLFQASIMECFEQEVTERTEGGFAVSSVSKEPRVESRRGMTNDELVPGRG